MSYDLDAFPLPPGRSAREFIESGDREALTDDDPTAERLDDEGEIEITSGTIQIMLSPREAGITVRYWYEGEEADAVLERALRVCPRAGRRARLHGLGSAERHDRRPCGARPRGRIGALRRGRGDDARHRPGHRSAVVEDLGVTRLAVISDTHLPRGGRALPTACLEQLRGADAILHAGDLMELSVLADLESIGPPVHAIRGNVDSAELQARLPLTRIVQVEGVRIAMVHDSGPAHGRLARLRRRFPEADAVVFGHSHLPAARGARRLRDLQPGLADRAPARAPPHHGHRHRAGRQRRLRAHRARLKASGAPPLYSGAPRLCGWAAATCRPPAASASA